ncbi:MAG: HEAT repeat domain-containing protein [Armatimonadetes bacterium]|nr:HEAT repeat domain-containing protein [Armatimonadota bacterium]
MRPRTYIIIGIILVLIAGGVIAAEIQRARKTRELLADLGTDASDVAKDTMEELRKRGGHIQDDLIQRTRSPRRKERMRAALLLGDVGSEKSGPALVVLLQDEWVPVRRAAVWALGRVGYPAAVSDLLAVVKDEEAEMDTRCLAVQSLSLLCMKGLEPTDRKLCIPAMTDILKRRPAMTEKALKAITKRLADQKKAKDELKERQRTGKPKEKKKEEPAEEPAETKAGEDTIPEEPVPADSEIELRGQAVLLLGMTGADEALQPLLESTREDVEPAALVRQYACMAIADMPEVPREPSAARETAMRLQRALDDGDTTVRMFAARALARHPDFGDEQNLLDEALNAKLAEMAQELTDLGEAGYWVREAARTACNARHLPYEKTETAKDEATPATTPAGVGGTGGN